MKSRKAARAIAGILLLAAGYWLAVPTPYRERTVFIDAGGCRMETAIIEKQAGAAQGSVVLLHGLSANKKIMSYLVHGFAEQGLRVYAPDLPGHGHTQGPFSPARAEQCGEKLLRELFARGVIAPNRTILAGHSMGGAIALRVGSRVQVAGVIAISPAPMRAAHGASPEMLLFTDPPPLPVNTLVISGSLEPESMRGNATDLAATSSDGSARYMEISKASHVSVLLSSATVRASQDWCARVLHSSPAGVLPSHRPLIGALAGFLGLVLLAGPFLREAAAKQAPEEAGTGSAEISLRRVFLEFAVGSILIVILMRFWIPLKPIHLFQGDYLASFLLLLGVVLTAVHWNSARPALVSSLLPMLLGALAGLALLLLFNAWFELTFYEAWIGAARWTRFPFLVLALFPYHAAEEGLLGPAQPGKSWRRLAIGFSLRVLTWGIPIAGVFLLHSGVILLVLLSVYFALFNLLQRGSMDIVREQTGSAAVTALFGAILLAGFCLVIFPVT